MQSSRRDREKSVDSKRCHKAWEKCKSAEGRAGEQDRNEWEEKLNDRQRDVRDRVGVCEGVKQSQPGKKKSRRMNEWNTNSAPKKKKTPHRKCAPERITRRQESAAADDEFGRGLWAAFWLHGEAVSRAHHHRLLLVQSDDKNLHRKEAQWHPATSRGRQK